jgi:hypothetical protein
LTTTRCEPFRVSMLNRCAVLAMVDSRVARRDFYPIFYLNFKI